MHAHNTFTCQCRSVPCTRDRRHIHMHTIIASSPSISHRCVAHTLLGLVIVSAPIAFMCPMLRGPLCDSMCPTNSRVCVCLFEPRPRFKPVRPKAYRATAGQHVGWCCMPSNDTHAYCAVISGLSSQQQLFGDPSLARYASKSNCAGLPSSACVMWSRKVPLKGISDRT